MAKSKSGRPGIYVESMNERAYKLCLLGLTDAELAVALGVTRSTINDWKTRYPEFSGTIKKGKAIADAKVAEALYRRACGYYHPEEKIFQHGGEVIRVETVKHYPPDTAAAFIWLKNRQGWRDKIDVDQKQEMTVRIDKIFEDA